jgi:hypothetical protein
MLGISASKLAATLETGKEIRNRSRRIESRWKIRSNFGDHEIFIRNLRMRYDDDFGVICLFSFGTPES